MYGLSEGKINTSAVKEGNIPFVVVNTTGWDRTGVVEMELETDRMYFSEAPLAEVIARMHEKKLPEYRVLDKDGREIPAVVTEIANHFNYDLPKDKFRQPYIAKRVKITMEQPVCRHWMGHLCAGRGSGTSECRTCKCRMYQYCGVIDHSRKYTGK